jgi:hypothetical protein
MHWWRANATSHPERLFDDERWNSVLGGADYVWERDIIKAKWDEGGWWDYDDLRNILYYVLGGAAAPVLLGVFFWSDRAAIIESTCRLLMKTGTMPLFCG